MSWPHCICIAKKYRGPWFTSWRRNRHRNASSASSLGLWSKQIRRLPSTLNKPTSVDHHMYRPRKNHDLIACIWDTIRTISRQNTRQPCNPPKTQQRTGIGDEPSAFTDQGVSHFPKTHRPSNTDTRATKRCHRKLRRYTISQLSRPRQLCFADFM